MRCTVCWWASFKSDVRRREPNEVRGAIRSVAKVMSGRGVTVVKYVQTPFSRGT
jgi:hypothetical protein